MANNEFSALSDRINITGGQESSSSKGNRSDRIIYPAIVRDVDDKADLNRIRAEIVFFDESGEIKGGKDSNTPADKLPLCIPLLPGFTHIRPEIGECVILFIENPADISSPRYWIGPIRTSRLKLDFEGYAKAQSIFDRNSFKKGEIQTSSTDNNDAKVAGIIPQRPEIAIQGKKDEDIVFKDREVVIRAGRFNKGTNKINTEHPCRIQLKQIEETESGTGLFTSLINKRKFKTFSQMNFEATNINLISVEGKNRDAEAETIETTTNQENLDRFGELSKKLHPLVFGDELVELLKLMISFMLTHIHTPQNPAVAPLEDISQLTDFKTDAVIQKILSKNVRTN